MPINKMVAFVVLVAITNQAFAMSMQDLFNAVGAQGNVTNPAALQGQTMNLYTGGSLFMRAPQRTYNLVNVTPPSFSAGCGGIDIYTGSLSYINKDNFVRMLRNIGSGMLGYGFKIAVQNLCPTCDNVMQALNATAQAINRASLDSCAAAEGIVNASVPATWEADRTNAAKNYGTQSGYFQDVADAWQQVGSSSANTNSTLNSVASSNPSAIDDIPMGNVVWKALKKMNGIDDNYRMIIMSMIGTTIYPTDGSSTAPSSLPGLGITLDQFVGPQNDTATLNFNVYQCDNPSDPEGCLHPTIVPITSLGSFPSFRNMVDTKINVIVQNIANRQPYSDIKDVIGFVNITDIPIYKLLSIGTSMGNTAITESLIERYEDLIAAKYAEVYIRGAVDDLRQSLAQYQSAASSPSIGDGISNAFKAADKVELEARAQVQSAYAQTEATGNMVEQVQFMERALQSNMSQILTNSLAFGRSLH